MTRSRRWLAAPALALSFALVGAACSGGSSGGGGDQAGSDSPPCPTTALDDATGTTDVVIWYQISGKAADTLEKMVQEYNASQSKVRVRAELQGASYEELLRKYEQAIPTNALPNIIVAEDTATQFLIDSGTVPVTASEISAASGKILPRMPSRIAVSDSGFMPTTLSAEPSSAMTPEAIGMGMVTILSAGAVRRTSRFS